MTGWSLAIDFGTTATTAVIIRGTEVTPVRFGVTTRMPSGVFVDDDEGFVAGTAGANRGGADPGRYVRTPKRHVGRDDTVVVAGREIPVTDLVATVLASTAGQATAQAGGGHPDTTVLTHPARWGTDAREVLTAAAKGAGLGDVLLVPEPVAAGHGGATEAMPVSALLAVYDLGGGTFDAVVLRKSDATTWSIEGSPGGIDPFGGESFDSILHRYVIEKVSALDTGTAARLEQPTTAAERGLARTWWRDLRAMKEDLSETSSSQIAVPGSDHAILVSRDELEDLLSEPISRSVAELERTIASGGAKPTTILLCGDASRMPLVHRLVQERFTDLAITTATDPKGVVALGAYAAAGTAPTPVADPVAPAEPELSPPPAAPPAPPPVPPPAAPPGAPRIDLDKRPVSPTAGPTGGWQGPPPLPPPVGPHPGDRPVSPPPAGKPSRLGLAILGTAAAFIIVIVGVGLALWLFVPDPKSDPKPPTPPSGSDTKPPTETAGATVADVAAAFDVADDKCTAAEDEVTCTSRDTATNTDLTTTFTKYAGASAAKTAFDDLAAKAKKANTAAFSSAYYAKPPASGARSSAAGDLLVAFGAAKSDSAFQFAATSDKLDSYVVGVEGGEYDVAEQKLLSLITDGTTPTAADVFGSTFGLAGYRACWPNLEWFTVVDGALPDFDCFTTTTGGRAGEIQGWYRKVDTTITDYFTKRKSRTGTTAVKDTTWNNAAQPGVARGPYVIIDAGAEAQWRYELMWADNSRPGLIASVFGNDVAALEKFWTDSSAPRS